MLTNNKVSTTYLLVCCWLQRLEEAKKKLDKIQHLAVICNKYEKESDLKTEEDTESNHDDRAEAYDNLDEAMVVSVTSSRMQFSHLSLVA